MQVGKLTEADPGAKGTSIVASLLASDATVGTLSSSEVEGTIKGKGKPKGSKGKRKQKQACTVEQPPHVENVVIRSTIHKGSIC